MANFAPFDYGDVIARGENIRGARTQNALRQQQLDPNSVGNQLRQEQLTGAKQGNVLAQQAGQRAQTTFDQGQELEGLKSRLRMFKHISADPSAASQYAQPLMDLGIDINSQTTEQIQQGATKGAYGLEEALSSIKPAVNRMGKHNPSDNTVESWAAFIKAGGRDQDAHLLVKYESPRQSPEDAAAVEAAKTEARLGARLKGEPEIARATGLATAATKVANKAYEGIDKIALNITNLREAMVLVKDGAGTGPLLSKLPSLRASSVALDTMQNRLGLDVVGAVTFGALSKGELDLAKSVALPQGLDGPELIEWIEAKISAQEKLSGYLEKQANFLSQGGSQAEWRQQLKVKAKAIKAAGLPSGTKDNGDGTFTMSDSTIIRKSDANP